MSTSCHMSGGSRNPLLSSSDLGKKVPYLKHFFHERLWHEAKQNFMIYGLNITLIKEMPSVASLIIVINFIRVIEIIITSATDYRELDVVFPLMLKLLIRKVSEVFDSTCA